MGRKRILAKLRALGEEAAEKIHSTVHKVVSVQAPRSQVNRYGADGLADTETNERRVVTRDPDGVESEWILHWDPDIKKGHVVVTTSYVNPRTGKRDLLVIENPVTGGKREWPVPKVTFSGAYSFLLFLTMFIPFFGWSLAYMRATLSVEEWPEINRARRISHSQLMRHQLIYSIVVILFLWSAINLPDGHDAILDTNLDKVDSVLLEFDYKVEKLCGVTGVGPAGYISDCNNYRRLHEGVFRWMSSDLVGMETLTPAQYEQDIAELKKSTGKIRKGEEVGSYIEPIPMPHLYIMATFNLTLVLAVWYWFRSLFSFANSADDARWVSEIVEERAKKKAAEKAEEVLKVRATEKAQIADDDFYNI